jgi:DNA polymerase-3 subunit delta'
MASALRSAAPEAGAGEIDDLVAVGQGSPGRALAFRGLDIAALDKAMRELAEQGDPHNARRSRLAQSLALKSAQPRYEAFLQRAPSLIAAIAKERHGPALAEALQLWEKAQSLASGAIRLSLDAESVVFELGGMLAALGPATKRG